MDQASYETRIAELEAWAEQMGEWATHLSETHYRVQKLLAAVGAVLSGPRVDLPETPLPPVRPAVAV